MSNWDDLLIVVNNICNENVENDIIDTLFKTQKYYIFKLILQCFFTFYFFQMPTLSLNNVALFLLLLDHLIKL